MPKSRPLLASCGAKADYIIKIKTIAKFTAGQVSVR